MNNSDTNQSRLIFLGGSIRLYEGEFGDEKPTDVDFSNEERRKIERFTAICEAVGEALGREGFGITGCIPHWSRALAAQEASKGLLRTNPDATFTTEGMEFPISDQQRLKLVQRVCAGVFIGGSNGTYREFELCKELEIRPLIPVAGAGGTGAQLVDKLMERPADFLNQDIDRSVLKGIALPDASPESYAEAVMKILHIHLSQELLGV